MGRTLIGGSAVGAPTTSTTTNSSSVLDPRKEGLPMFAVWSMYDDQFRYVQCSTYGPDGSQTNNPWAYAVYSSPSGSYQGGVIQDKYLGYSGDAQGWFRTSSSVSSNSTSYMVGRTQDNCHWPSAHSLNVGPTGQFAANISGSNNASRSYTYYMRWMTTQVLPEGVRPRVFLGNDGVRIFRSLKPSDANYGLQTETFSINDADMIAAHPGINNRRYGSSMGMSGYNEKTGYYVILLKTTSGDVDMFKFKLKVRITDPKVRLKDAFLDAEDFEYRQMDGVTNLSSGDGYYRGVITVGDNGYCRWTRWSEANSVIETQLFHLDSSVASTFIRSNTPDSTGRTYGAQSTQYAHSDNNSTTYGIDQGNYHIGIQYNSTWDNKWHLHFGHYYYYGSGINAYITSTEDPRICYRFSKKETTFCASPIASGRRGFIFSRDANSDSSDMYWTNLNMAGAATTVEEVEANTAAGKSYPRGSIYTYTNVNLTSDYQEITNTDMSGLVPAHGYYSTNYPRLINVNWWPTSDGRLQFGGDY